MLKSHRKTISWKDLPLVADEDEEKEEDWVRVRASSGPPPVSETNEAVSADGRGGRALVEAEPPMEEAVEEVDPAYDAPPLSSEEVDEQIGEMAEIRATLENLGRMQSVKFWREYNTISYQDLEEVSHEIPWSPFRGERGGICCI